MEFSETVWGEIDKTALAEAVKEHYAAGEFSRADVEEIYAYAPDAAFSEDAAGERELLTSKLGGPHHEVDGDEIVLNKSGVIALAEALSGARGGVDWDEEWVAQAKEHVARHYDELDMELPGALKTVSVWRDKDGALVWQAISSCAVWDLEGEKVSTEAMDHAIKSNAAKDNFGELRVEHLTASRIGVCTGQKRLGIFLLEWGAFDDNDRGRTAYETIKADNSGKYRVSIGFWYGNDDLVDGIFKKIEQFERSVTTRPAVPYTAIGIAGGGKGVMGKTVSAEAKATLEKLVGAEEAAQVLAQSKSVDSAGQEVAFKDEANKEVNEEGQPVRRFGDMMAGAVGQNVHYWADEWLMSGMLSEAEHTAVLAAVGAAVTALRGALPDDVARRESQGWGFMSLDTPRAAQLDAEQVKEISENVNAALAEQEGRIVFDDALVASIAGKVAEQVKLPETKAVDLSGIETQLKTLDAAVTELLKADGAKVQEALDGLPRARVFRATQAVGDGENEVSQTAPASPLSDLPIYNVLSKRQ